MSTINWTVTVGATSFTNITQSLSFNFGRNSYFDTWTGNTCTFTVRNNTGQAANISEGDQIIIENNLSTSDLYFYVVEVTFQDDIASGANTATITGIDAFGMLSLFYVNDDPIIGTTNAIRQAIKLANEVYPFVPPYPPPTEFDGRATVSDAFDPTTIGQRIGELLATENSNYYYDGATIEFTTSNAPADVTFTIGLSSSTSVVYDGLTRKYPNANYPNVVTLTSTTVGTTFASSPSNYERNYNRQVLFNNLAQQQAQTDWFAAVLSQEALYVDVRFSDSANTTTQITKVLNDLPGMSGGSVLVTYNVPGGSSTQTRFVIEGGSCSAVPGRTDFTLYLSPTVIYDLFTLDSSTFGVLGGTMTYDTPITYDDEGETYDASTTDNGNRLGW